jgi:hypothetical protein
MTTRKVVGLSERIHSWIGLPEFLEFYGVSGWTDLDGMVRLNDEFPGDPTQRAEHIIELTRDPAEFARLIAPNYAEA